MQSEITEMNLPPSLGVPWAFHWNPRFIASNVPDFASGEECVKPITPYLFQLAIPDTQTQRDSSSSAHKESVAISLPWVYLFVSRVALRMVIQKNKYTSPREGILDENPWDKLGSREQQDIPMSLRHLFYFLFSSPLIW